LVLISAVSCDYVTECSRNYEKKGLRGGDVDGGLSQERPSGLRSRTRFWDASDVLWDLRCRETGKWFIEILPLSNISGTIMPKVIGNAEGDE
jgi:hypothetical protein